MRMILCLMTMLIAVPATAGEYLAVLTGPPWIRGGAGIAIVDPRTGEVCCSTAWQTGEYEPAEAATIGDGHGRTAPALVFKRVARPLTPPEDADPPTMSLFTLDLTTLRPDTCVATLLLDPVHVTDAPWVGKVYVWGVDAAREWGTRAVSLSFADGAWQARIGDAPDVYSAELRPGVPMAWSITDTREYMDVACVDMRDDSIVTTGRIEGEEWYRSHSAVLDETRALIGAYRDPDSDVRGDEEMLFFLWSSDGSRSIAQRSATRERIGPAVSDDAYWVLTGYGSESGAVELRYLDGTRGEPIDVGARYPEGLPREWLRLRDGVMAAIVPRGERTGGRIIVIDPTAGDARTVQLEDRVIVSACVVELSDEQLAELRDRLKPPEPVADELPWPTGEELAQQGEPARDAAGWVRQRLGAILKNEPPSPYHTEWVPQEGALTVTRLPRWEPAPGAVHAVYTVEPDIFPRHAYRFEWLLSPPDADEPWLACACKGVGAWRRGMGIRAEPYEDLALAYAMARELLPWVSEMTWLERYRSRGRVVTCHRADQPDVECYEWDSQGRRLQRWVTRAGTEVTLHLQAKPSPVVPAVPELLGQQ